MIQIRNKNLETEKLSLDIDREREYARLEQEREVGDRARRAARRGGARARAAASRRPSSAQIAAAQSDRDARASAPSARSRRSASAASARSQRLEIERRKALELAEQQRAIAIAAGSRRPSPRPRPRPSTARAQGRGGGGEGVHRARDRDGRAPQGDRADRRRAGGRARRAAPHDRRPRPRSWRPPTAATPCAPQAEAEADADKIRALAARLRHEIEAEGTRLMNEAQNMLTPEARASALRLRLVDKLEGIIRESGAAAWRRSRASRSCMSTGSAAAAAAAAADGGRRQLRRQHRQLARCATAPRRRWSTSCCARSASSGGDISKLGGMIARAGRLPMARRRTQAERERAMIKVYMSSVIDAPADAVWARDPRFQRPAEMAPAHRRQPRSRADCPPTGSAASATSNLKDGGNDPRAAADALGLRLQLHLLDPRIADGRATTTSPP